MPLPAFEVSRAVAEESFPRWKCQDVRVHWGIGQHCVEFHVVEPAAIVSALIAVVADGGFELEDAGFKVHLPDSNRIDKCSYLYPHIGEEK